MSKPSLLIEAHNLINGDRQLEYGNPSNTFIAIASQWNMYLNQKYGTKARISPEDVCWMMSDLKKVRQMQKQKRDNLVDAAGYIGLIGVLKDGLETVTHTAKPDGEL